jgi:putative hydrolase of the HAD superfamily
MMHGMTIEWVFLDVGGIIFSDASYFTSLYEAIAQVAPSVERAEFDARFDELRAAQAEPFTEALVAGFVSDRRRHDVVRADADARWEKCGYTPEEVYPEVPDALKTLASRYRVACITNHFSWVRDRARAAGFDDFISVWAISSELRVEKPDPAIFKRALREADVGGEVVAMVGDRLDRDIAPANALGMRTVWVLRNEAPDAPTPEQLAVPDATVRTLEEVPALLEGW